MINFQLDELYSSVQFTEIYGQLTATALNIEKSHLIYLQRPAECLKAVIYFSKAGDFISCLLSIVQSLCVFSGANPNILCRPNPDAYDTFGGSLLMIAIDKQADECIPILLERPEVDLHLRMDNISALDIAACWGYEETLDQILAVSILSMPFPGSYLSLDFVSDQT